MEDVRVYFFDCFFFLRIVFDIFNITFHFCFLRSTFWGGFLSIYPFDCHVRHMRMALQLRKVHMDLILIFLPQIVFDMSVWFHFGITAILQTPFA